MPKKILIAGGGYADIPMILSAKKLGLKVYTTGNRPEEMGHKYSDEYIPADFSDRQAILDICRKLKVDGVCPCCNDFSALSAAYAAEQLGLPGHDSPAVLETLMHKDKFRYFCREHGLPTPHWHSQDAAAPLPDNLELRYPLIVKPVDLTGGKGIAKVNNFEELTEAVRKATTLSRSRQIVIEEFIVPDDFHHNFVAFLRNGKVAFYNSDNEHYYKNKFLVWGMSVPTSAPKAIDEQLVAHCEKVAALLKLKDGLVLMQHCVRDGELLITEFSRRMPGNLHGRLIELSTGFEISKYAIMTSMGMDCSEAVHKEPMGYWSENCIMADRNGYVQSMILDECIKGNVVESVIWGEKDYIIDNYMVDKLGILLMCFDTYEDMLEKSESMFKFTHINFA